MSKLAIQYTDDNGVVFSIEAEYDTFKAGRTDLNNGRLINIPDMKQEEAWKHSQIEGILISTGIRIGTAIGAFDPKAANATDSINNKKHLNNDEQDEDFV